MGGTARAALAIATLACACRKPSAPVEVALVQVDTADVVAVTPLEPPSTPFACDGDLLVVGREWIEETTTTATATGTGGFMGQPWDGKRRSERRVRKKILAMDGDRVTKMRITFLVDHDADGATDLDGKTFHFDGDELTPQGDDAKEALDRHRDEVLTVAQEMKERWRGDTRALATRFRTYIGWSEHEYEDTPPWGRVTIAPAFTKPRYVGARAFSASGFATDTAVATGHLGRWRIHTAATIVVLRDGALGEAAVTTKSWLAERLNFGCGEHQTEPCAWSDTLLTTTVTSFRVLCD